MMKKKARGTQFLMLVKTDVWHMFLMEEGKRRTGRKKVEML